MRTRNPIVICCSHNGRGYIVHQLMSVFESLEKPEVKLFDFGSTDETVELVSKTFGDDVEVFSMRSAPGARDSFFHAFCEVAPQLEDDDVVFVIDQDDVWFEEKGRIITQLMTSQNLDLCYHDVAVVDSELVSIRDGFYEKHIYPVEDFSVAGLRYFNPVIGHTVCASGRCLKEFVHHLEFYNHFLMHDWALAVFCASSSKYRVLYCDQVLSMYRQHDGNIIGESRRDIFQKITKAFDLIKSTTMQFSVYMAKLRGGGRLQSGDVIKALYIMPRCGQSGARLAFFWGSVVYSTLLAIFFFVGGKRLIGK